MASEVDICNRALQKLGASRITNLTEDSRNARECNVAYEPLRDAELRRHVWNFARKRARLPASATAPAFGYNFRYTLPADFIRLHPGVEANDWQIEYDAILTNHPAPLDIVYICRVEDPNRMDALFREALAARLAYELCEVITQSNTKKAEARSEYLDIIQDAKRVNAIENVSAVPPDDEWEEAWL